MLVQTCRQESYSSRHPLGALPRRRRPGPAAVRAARRPRRRAGQGCGRGRGQPRQPAAPHHRRADGGRGCGRGPRRAPAGAPGRRAGGRGRGCAGPGVPKPKSVLCTSEPAGARRARRGLSRRGAVPDVPGGPGLVVRSGSSCARRGGFEEAGTLWPVCAGRGRPYFS